MTKDHDCIQQNPSCAVQFEHIAEKIMSLDGRVDILKGANERSSQSLIDLLPRIDNGHRRVDNIEKTMISIDKTLTSLLAVTEIKERAVVKFAVQVASIEQTLIDLKALVKYHDDYIKEDKENKKNLTGWVMSPLISGVIGGIIVWIGSKFSGH